jgi:putative membrane-bound dehydrogenase-like protein
VKTRAPIASIGLFWGAAVLFHAVAAAQEPQAEPSLRDLIKPLPAPSPEEAVKSIRVPPGFRVELVAAEPDVVDPVAIAFDENGRMFVAEDIDYPQPPAAGQRPLSRIRLLEDLDGDGRYETSTIFAEGLQYPSGIACHKGGIFVSAPPRIEYLKDTDDDKRADVRRVVYDGFGTQTAEDIMNNLKRGIDNWIYGASSYNGGDVRRPDAPDEQPVSVRNRDFRFHPDTGEFTPLAGSGDFGNTFDDWGNRFVANPGMLLIQNVLAGDSLARNPHLNVGEVNYKSGATKRTVASLSPPEPWRVVRKNFWHKWVNTTPDMRASRFTGSELAEGGFVTGVAGCEIYRGDAFPAEFAGDSFTAEPACNAVIRLKLKPNGVLIDAVAVDEKREFLASTDNWFRPVNISNGPDGCLYVVDMAREIIEDPSAIPDDILQVIDVTRGRDMGRIYRVVPDGFRRPAAPRLDRLSDAELAGLLPSGNAWTRETAQRLIVERNDRAAAVPLSKILESTSPVARLHALWSLQGIGQLTDAQVLQAMSDAHHAIRRHAVRIAEQRAARAEGLRGRLIELAGDDDPRVRMQVAFSLGAISDRADAQTALARILARDADDRWIVRAVLSSVGSAPGPILTALLLRPGFLSTPAAESATAMLAEQVAVRRDGAALRAMLAQVAQPRLEQHPGVARGILLAAADGQARSNQSLAGVLAEPPLEAVRAMFQTMLADAEKTLADAASPADAKLRSIRLLRHAPPGGTDTVLDSLIDASQPPEVQLASIQALAGQAAPGVGGRLLARWRGVSPAVRREMIEALLRDPARLPALLDAIENKQVLPVEIDAPQRDAIARGLAEPLRSRALELFGSATAAPRRQVIADYQAALKLAGDRRRGTEVFAKHCATCHRLEGVGKAIGPDLVGVRSKTPDAVLTSILDPSREVAASYLNYIVVTKDGRVATGLLIGESPTAITLRRAEAAEDIVPRADIEELNSTGKSLMPEGMEQQIDHQSMADLIQFLMTDQAP